MFKVFQELKLTALASVFGLAILFSAALASQPAQAAEIEDGGYYLAVTLDYGFDEAYERVSAALKSEGFGIQHETDFQAVMKAKLGKDIPRYLLLAACHPELAFETYSNEDWAGIMMPCTVVIRELPDGNAAVAIKHPGMLPIATGNDALSPVSKQLVEKSMRVLAAL